jgi:hypothetical protein
VVNRFPGLCGPVACMESYIAATVDLRQPDVDSLFLSIWGPHRPVTSSTVGRCIKWMYGISDPTISAPYHFGPVRKGPTNSAPLFTFSAPFSFIFLFNC